MKQTRRNLKLKINRSTIRQLGAAELRVVEGGGDLVTVDTKDPACEAQAAQTGKC